MYYIDVSIWMTIWLTGTIHREMDPICYSIEIPTETYESYEFLYVVYMNIMQAWSFECKAWSMCIHDSMIKNIMRISYS